MAATLHFKGVQRSDSEWAVRTMRASAGLEALGFGGGCRIGILLRNCPEFLEAYRAIGGAGSVPVPISTHLAEPDLVALLTRENFGAIVTSNGELPEYDGVARVILVGKRDDSSLGWEDLCAAGPGEERPPKRSPESRFFTSGSTALPKTTVRQPLPSDMADLRNRRFLSSWRIDEGMRTAVTGPLYHQAPLHHALASMDRAERLVILDDFSADALLDAIIEHSLTHLHLVPRMMRKLLELGDGARTLLNPNTLEFVLHGAAACPRDVKERMIDWWGPIFREYYASSEFGMMTSVDTPVWLSRPTSVGEPFVGVDIEIRDLETGANLPAGSKGVVFVRSDDMPTFTYEAGSADASEPRTRGDFITMNDVGWLDEDGCLHLYGRSDGIAVISGVNCSAETVRAALVRLDYVSDAIVRAFPDPEQGQRFVASVVLAAGSTNSAENVMADLRRARLGLAMPRIIGIVDTLPETETGKIIARYLPVREDGARNPEENMDRDTAHVEEPPRFPVGLVIVEKEETGSTNSDAIELLRGAASSPTLIWAKRQTAGRGRNKRNWISPEGNIYWTMLIDITDEIHPYTGLVFVSSLAVWMTARAVVSPEAAVQIKWPNDTLIEGRKVSGVLIETAHASNRLWAAVGIGINVNSHPETGTMYPATDLRAEGATAQRNQVLGILTGNFLDCLEMWRAGGFAALRTPYLNAAYRHGQLISVSTGPLSEDVVAGIFHDIDENGLLLHTKDGPRKIAAGDLIRSC
ncbi:biotin--[acetyl-CoA-carboxylase] ligase [Sphingomonas sp. QA11]|uniref:biotin--[acetyl-CoA-carboxylase] ligase n=1 Tax=Sphingomonas sp. QA11 TaxID=2950605 RepID=UPI00234B7576|nr:biotin--[acetyl-CoA-carboxylase] ligase [Sphingomonas sp. QA11]WCM29621.1 biotin--[acetyl-CoA-carboxylase] ligase [Sphingomonas sp. QA11]